MESETPTGSRATTLEELDTIFGKFFDEAAEERGLEFKPQPSDIIISPYAKSGTTLLQQIAHGLRTRGSMEFDEITVVTPWIEIAYDVGWDLEAPQVAEPRYRFFEGWYFEPGTISLETLIHWRWPRDEVDSKGYWYHLGSWLEQRDNTDVLLLCYEDMTADLPGTVRKIAYFMGITLDDELLDIVVRQSSREFMLAHIHQYDTHHIVEIGGKRAGLPPAIDTNKVTPGTPKNPRYQLSSEIKEELDNIWREQIQPKFGFKNYEELRQSLKDMHESSGH